MRGKIAFSPGKLAAIGRWIFLIACSAHLSLPLARPHIEKLVHDDPVFRRPIISVEAGKVAAADIERKIGRAYVFLEEPQAVDLVDISVMIPPNEKSGNIQGQT